MVYIFLLRKMGMYFQSKTLLMLIKQVENAYSLATSQNTTNSGIYRFSNHVFVGNFLKFWIGFYINWVAD